MNTNRSTDGWDALADGTRRAIGPGWEAITDGVDGAQGWQLYPDRYAALVKEDS